MLNKSLVSVILPVHNTGRFLTRCLNTLTKQSYANLEIIAIDDKSKDNSLKILKQFKKKYKNIQIIRNKKHYGAAICLNRALRLAKGQFIAFMNPNDTVSLHRFKKQVDYLRANSKTVVVGSQFTTINADNELLEKSNLPQEHEAIYQTLLPSLSIKPETVMINRVLLPRDILHFTTNKYPLVFTEVFIKLLQYGKIANLNQFPYYRRTGISRYARRHSKVKQILSLMRLLLKSRTTYDYRPSLRFSISTMLKGI